MRLVCRGEAIPFSTLSLRAERMRSVAILVGGVFGSLLEMQCLFMVGLISIVPWNRKGGLA